MKSHFVLIILFANCVLFGQAPKFSNDFLNIGVGARGMAMAGAAGAHTVSVQAAYWNPAGLADNPSKFQVSAQHAEYFSGIGNYDYIAFGKRMDEDGKSFGSLSLIRMAIDNIPSTLNLIGPDGSIDYHRIESFSVADYAVFLSYARKLNTSPWSVGGSAKIIHRTYGPFGGAWGFGLDAGVKYNGGKITFALMGRDITTTFNASNYTFTNEQKATLHNTGNDIPSSSVEYTLPKLIASGAYKMKVSEKMNLLTAVDLEFSTNGTKSAIIASNHFNIDPKIGLELDYNQKMFLRAGAGNFQSVLATDGTGTKEFSFYPTAGLGIKLGKITLDYAMTNIGSAGVGLYSHYFSLNLDF